MEHDQENLANLSDAEKADILRTLRTRIIEDIYTYCFTKDMVNGKEGRSITEILDEFFQENDLRFQCFEGMHYTLGSLATSERREL